MKCRLVVVLLFVLPLFAAQSTRGQESSSHSAASANRMASGQQTDALQIGSFSFRDLGGYGLLTDISLDGKQIGKFMIDTGSDPNVLSQSMANKLHLTPIPARIKGKPYTIGGKETSYVLVPNVQARSITLSKVPFIVTETANLTLPSGETFDGIIGSMLLRNYAVLFDFQKHQISLWRSGNLTPKTLKEVGMAQALAVSGVSDFGGFVFAIPVQFSNTVNADLVIDTGSAASVVTSSMAQRLHLKPSKSKPEKYASYSGPVFMLKTENVAITLSSLTLKHTTITYPDGEETSIRPCIGMNILSQYKVIIDYPANKIYLQAITHSSATDAFKTQNGE